MREGLFQIAANTALRPDVFRLRLTGDVSACQTPGQFAALKLEGQFLRRPFSVCDVDGESLTLVYQVKGRGTQALSQMRGGTLDVLTGLGKGFAVDKAGASPLLIAGGLGFTPLYWLAKTLPVRPTVLLGFGRGEDILYENEFRALGCEVLVCTEDGSRGFPGRVTEAMAGLTPSFFYACGPEGMLKAVERTAPCDGQLSLEARMGCGFGACMGCGRETVNGVRRVCRDGPVFQKGEIVWGD
ncbi:MAG: dihydroorotate dehydrogenase electron transfer subunit [Oscillospiraceae bacterium]|nr:dihydroorotate dehydrogenase electron transfer subunit [Oscillospiraceae bacterium]